MNEPLNLDWVCMQNASFSSLCSVDCLCPPTNFHELSKNVEMAACLIRWHGDFWFFPHWGSGWYVNFLKANKEKSAFFKLKFLFQQLYWTLKSWKRCWFNIRFDQHLYQQINPGQWTPNTSFILLLSLVQWKGLEWRWQHHHYPEEQDSELFFPSKRNNINSASRGMKTSIFHENLYFSWKPIPAQWVNHSYFGETLY